VGALFIGQPLNKGSLGIKLGFGRARGVHGPKAQLAAHRPIVKAGDSGVGSGDSGLGRRLRSVSGVVSGVAFRLSSGSCWGRSGGRSGDSGVAGPETPV
jgi:hypothetical protein